MKKLKRFFLNCSLAIFALGLALGAGELVLRHYHFAGAKISWSEPDPLIAWRYTPGAKYWFFQENAHPIAGRINRQGWRDKEWVIQKPANTIRIAVLGDSFVDALQVEQDSTFLALAETKLNHKAPPRFELMNFGRAGFTTIEEFLIIDREVAPFSPDMIVLFFFPENDIEDVSPELDPNAMRPFFVPAENGELVLDLSFAQSTDFKIRKSVNGLKQHSALFSLLVERINLLRYGNGSQATNTASIPQPSQPATPALRRINGALSLATANPDPRYQRAFELNKAILKKIAGKCRQVQAKFLLASINIAAYHPDLAAQWRAIDPTFNPCYFDETLAEFARQNHIDFIGLQKIFMDAYQKNGRKLQWTHWNYAGHELVAQVLADHLERMDKANLLSSASL